MPKTITAIFKGGQTKIETSGFEGETCKEATARLQARLGITDDDDPTPEMFAGANEGASAEQH